MSDEVGQQQRQTLSGSQVLFGASRRRCDILHVGRGDEIVAAGAGQGFVYFIESGFCASTKSFDEDARQLVAIHLPGDLINHEALTVGLPAAAFALTGAVLARISVSDFQRVLASDPLFGELFLGLVAHQGVLAQTWLFRTGGLSALQKTAHLLCELHDPMRAAGLVESGETPFPLTQREMAAALGLSIVHVNRSFQLLRKAGLVRIDRQRFRILNEADLSRLARFDGQYLKTAQKAVPHAGLPTTATSQTGPRAAVIL